MSWSLSQGGGSMRKKGRGRGSPGGLGQDQTKMFLYSGVLIIQEALKSPKTQNAPPATLARVKKPARRAPGGAVTRSMRRASLSGRFLR